MDALDKPVEGTDVGNEQIKGGITKTDGDILENIQHNKDKEDVDKLFEYENESGLVAPIMVLLEKLRHRVEYGEYTSILGIDGSGRLPALLLAETLKHIYKIMGIHKELKQYFVAGNRSPNNTYIDQLGKVIDKKTDNPYTFIQERCLVVDDWFFSGDTLKSISQILAGKIPFDIATLHLRVENHDESYDAQMMREKFRKDTSFVEYGIHGKPDYYGKNQFHGLEKNRKKNPGAKSTILNESFISKVQAGRDMELIGYVRKKIKQVAQDMANKFVGK